MDIAKWIVLLQPSNFHGISVKLNLCWVLWLKSLFGEVQKLMKYSNASGGLQSGDIVKSLMEKRFATEFSMINFLSIE